jgi:hypothetical protein
MINATETNASAAVAAASANGSQETGDADRFIRELQARLGEGADADKIAQGMNRLVSAFPDMNISSYSFGSFESSTTYFINLNDDTTLNISPSLIAEMADNDEAFEKIKTMVGSLFSAGGNQNLVDVGGTKTQRNVVVDETTTRYVEVQRDENGRALSVVSLALETQKMIAETLDRLLATHQMGGGNSGQFKSLFDFYFQGSATSSQSWGFGGLMTSTNSWQLEGMITGVGVVNAENAASQSLFASQRTSTQLQVIVEQWQVEAEGKMDLFTYMQVMGLCDPLVFDLGDEGINLTSAEEGVYFDIKGDGTPVKTGWISGNNAFLYLDQNGNGVVDDANELFGDHSGFANGFAKLAQYDDNGDGVIDENDAIYNELRLWRDLNGDGVNQADESMTLADAGIQSINLRYNDSKELDRHGNVIGEKSSFTRTDGTQGLVADAWFRNI